MIRFLYLNTFIALFTIFFSLWGLIVSLFDRSNGRYVHFYSARPWARGILRVCGVRVTVRGLDKVDGGFPHIFMVNHQSAFDIFTLLAFLPVDFKFILKQELMKIPLFGWAMKKAGYIAIDRKDPRKAIKSMNRAAEKIKQGASVLIFPEGTRSENGRLQGFKKGGFHLAIKSGCEIVPVVIFNSRYIAQKGSMRINSGEILMKICEPVAAKDYGRKDLNRLMERVRRPMAELLS